MDTGKQYVGITTQPLKRRVYEHGRSAQKGITSGRFPSAIRKYGISRFLFVELAHARSWEELCELEIILIAQYGTFGKSGYNSTKGGKGGIGLKKTPEQVEKTASKIRGRKHTAASRALMSKNRKAAVAGKKFVPWNKGTKLSEEGRKKLSEAHKGKKLSEEQKKKLSDAMKGKAPCELAFERAWAATTGKTVSEKEKARLLSYRLGSKTSESTKKKISVSHKALWAEKTRPSPSEETRKKISKSVKALGAVPEERKIRISESLKAHYAKKRAA